jgi:HEAT repeat protein
MCAALVLAACSATVPPSYGDPTPEARIGAIRQTVAEGRRQDIPHLVECLSSDDPAVRLAAVDALQSLAGTTLGYRASAPPAERAAAIAAWKSWVIDQGLQPAQAAE